MTNCPRCQRPTWQLPTGSLCPCGLYWPSDNKPLRESYRHKPRFFTPSRSASAASRSGVVGGVGLRPQTSHRRQEARQENTAGADVKQPF